MRGTSCTFAAIMIIVMVLLFGGSFSEAYALANDQEQSIGRVFQMVRRIIEASPLLKREAKITQDRITFPGINALIAAIASDAGSAAGANATISVFDELWDEMVPPPTRKIACRFTCTYAGYQSESVLLEELYKRGLQQPQVGTDLYAGDGLLMFWSHVPIASWQDEAWLASMRHERASAYQRMVLNEFASSESRFVDMSAWDACVQPALTPVQQDRQLNVWIGVDASVRRDSTALVACTYDKKAKVVRLVAHRVFVPSASDPIDFELVETTLLDWAKNFRVKRIYFDPFQFVSTAQRLEKAHIAIEPYAQTVPNLTAATQGLYDLLQSRSIVLYPDAQMRLAISRAIIVESARGWRLDKLKQHHHIDIVVALSMAALAAVRGQSEPSYDLWACFPDEESSEARNQQYRNALAAQIFAFSGGRLYPR
jgi:phage terminase large subunit-like protein